MSRNNLPGPTLVVVVPHDLARELQDSGIGAVVARARHQAGATEVVLTVLSTSSSVVTLLVARQDLAELIGRLSAFLRRTRSKATLEVPDEMPEDVEAALRDLMTTIRQLGDLLLEQAAGKELPDPKP